MTTIGRRLDDYVRRNVPLESGTDFGRLDALGITLNEVFHRALGPRGGASPTDNARRPDAPTSYPFLWDTPQHDRVQWIGVMPNGGFRNVGGLARNVQESFCALAELEISEDLRAIGLSDLDQGHEPARSSARG